MFCNHGCNGTYNYGNYYDVVDDVKVTELNVDQIYPDTTEEQLETVYSPIRERHIRQDLTVGDYTLREIKTGEEILCNYVNFIEDPDEWDEEVAKYV